ncbi:MAG: DUF2061 domain-containing protein [Flavobacteriales bacterium]
MKLIKRHIAKTISWRCVGTLDTLLLSWLISGDLFVGVKVSLLEVITKMILYYLHERIWFKSSLKKSNKRHILKTFSWRAIGTLDTIVLAWMISGDSTIGLKIGVAEVITKMILYYLHEKVWYKSNYGLETRK